MTRRKKNKIIRWYLLWRKENGRYVWIYEPLTFRQLNERMSYGWHVIGPTDKGGESW